MERRKLNKKWRNITLDKYEQGPSVAPPGCVHQNKNKLLNPFDTTQHYMYTFLYMKFNLSISILENISKNYYRMVNLASYITYYITF